MVDPAGGYHNSYRNNSSIKPMSSESTKAPEDTGGAGGAIGYLLHGEPDKRAPDEKPENKQGMFGGFLSGFFNGLKSSVKSLFSVKGLLMMGAIAALTIATGGAITPFLLALGAGVGMFQMGQGFMKGDWEQMGRGAFTLGSTAVLAKVDFKTATKYTPGAKGEKFALAVGKSKQGYSAAANKTPGIMDNFRLLAGQKMQGSNGSQQSIYQVLGNNAKFRLSQARGAFDTKA
jgi:hypothetical protein